MKKLFLILTILSLQSCEYAVSTIANNVTKIESNSISKPNITLPSLNLDSEIINPSNQIERINKDFSYIDSKFTNMSSSDQSSIDNLVNFISKNASNDMDKVRLIHKWITNNISYDANCFFNNSCGSMSAESVFVSKKAVCQGYANLFKLLADKLSIKSYIVSGYANGYGGIDLSKTNHAWNSVKIDGQWYLIDTTWSAGYINDQKQFTKSPSDAYFLTPPNQFITDHLPEDDKWQLLSQKVDKNTYQNFPDIQPLFFIQGFELISHKNKLITSANNELKITLKNNKINPEMTVSLSKDNNKIENSYLIEKEGEFINIYVRFPEKGNYNLSIYSKENKDSKNYSNIVEYKIEALSSTDNLFPTFYSTEYDYTLITPKNRIIDSGKREFRIKIKNVKDVVVISSDNIWTYLSKDKDDTYYGGVEIIKGKTKISVKKDNSNYASTLVEFEAN
jgi:hypothetical protein